MLKKWWRDLSVSKKLYLVVGIMAVLVGGELFAVRFAMDKISTARALVAGESKWSKAQKNAAFNLQRYTFTHDERDYQNFLKSLKIIEGDRRARIELQKAHPDLKIVYDSFMQGDVHPDDIKRITSLPRSYFWEKHIQKSMQLWVHGDLLVEELSAVGANYRSSLDPKHLNRPEQRRTRSRIHSLNSDLDRTEIDFSRTLGEASRWMENLVFLSLFVLVLAVKSVGLTLTFITARRISRGLTSVTNMAVQIGAGNFSKELPVQSRDEIGMLMTSINNAGRMLESSYKQLEDRVRERTRELNEALQARDEFVSIASHELKTPLTALFLHIQMISRILRSRPPSEVEPRLIESVDLAIKQGNKISALIDELLDLARIRAGKLSLNIQECELGSFIQDAVAPLSSVAKGKGSDLFVELQPSVVCRIDPVRMGQVVTNLLSNAINYGQGKPIALKLRSSGDTACLSIRDQGLGIPSEKQKIIFERFERAIDSSTVSGLRLGLYITRQIVEAHGGRIQLQSELGRGSEFSVVFPLSSPAG